MDIPLTIKGSTQSDGYHTFKELYDHRTYLMLSLMTLYPEISWRTLNHNKLQKDKMYEGYCLIGMNLPTGTISYHIEIHFWKLLDNLGITTLEEAPEYDGYTSNDVLLRLFAFINEHKVCIH